MPDPKLPQTTLDPLMVEGYAGQLHANHHLTAGRIGYIAWPKVREDVREKWRAQAREHLAEMEAARAR